MKAGLPQRSMIPYGRQDVTDDDIREVVSVLNSNFLTQGPQVPIFEKAVAAHVGSRHAIAVNSATSALHVACMALGLEEGDALWTSAITFPASANCGLYCGATVDFVDIDPITYNMCPVALEKKLRKASKQGTTPKIVIPVHLAGQSCDMAAIRRLSREYDFKIIEDASHAIGAHYAEGSVGNCAYSEITVFSFHPVKIITSGEGGMAVTNDAELGEKMRLLRSHGITREKDLMRVVPEGDWYYEQIDLGFNYRMTDIHAALGVSQLARLETYVAIRQKLADRYDCLLQNLPLQLPERNVEAESSFHLYIVRLDSDAAQCNRRQLFDSLRAKGIGVNVHYIPVYRHPYFESMGFDRSQFYESERYYEEALSLPIFPRLSDADQQYVVDMLAEELS